MIRHSQPDDAWFGRAVRQNRGDKSVVVFAILGGLVTGLLYLMSTPHGTAVIAAPELEPVPGQALIEYTSPATPTEIDYAASAHSEQSLQETPSPPSLGSFRLRLSENNFESAIELYDRIYVGSALEVSARYRDVLMVHASSLNQNRKYDLALSLLNAYLQIYYTDVEALILQARVYRNIGRNLNAIQSFQQAHLNEYRQSVSGLILNQENTVIREHVQNLAENNDLQGITDLYQWLTQSQSSVSGYFFGLANAYAAQKRFAEAITTLRYVLYDPAVGVRAHSLLDEYSRLKTRDNQTAPLSQGSRAGQAPRSPVDASTRASDVPAF